MEILCLDFGGSSLKGAIIDDSGSMDNRFTEKLTATKASDIIDLIEELVNKNPSVAGVSISYCGECDPIRGYIYHGGSYPYMNEFPLKEEVEKRTGLFTAVEKDANCAALCELDASLKDSQNAVCLILGSAVGCSLILNRKIYHGSHFFNGFVSSMSGSIEQPLTNSTPVIYLCSTTALIQRYQKDKESLEEVDGKIVFERIHNQEKAALKAFDAFTSNIANLIYNMQLILDCDSFAIGGGISQQDILIDSIRQKVEENFSDPFLSQFPCLKPEIKKCTYQNDANLIGAFKHFNDLYQEG